MKKLLFIPILFLCGLAFAQKYNPENPTEYGHKSNREMPLIVQHIPEKNGLIVGTSECQTQIFLNTQDNKIYYYSCATGFVEVGTGGSGGNLDTVAVGYLLKLDSVRLHAKLMRVDSTKLDSTIKAKSAIPKFYVKSDSTVLYIIDSATGRRIDSASFFGGSGSGSGGISRVVGGTGLLRLNDSTLISKIRDTSGGAYYSYGNLGIGDIIPNYPLEVLGNISSRLATINADYGYEITHIPVLSAEYSVNNFRLFGNTTTYSNASPHQIAIGDQALQYSDDAGTQKNIAIGDGALRFNNYDLFAGGGALENIAIGYQAGYNNQGYESVIIGNEANYSGTPHDEGENVIIGYTAARASTLTNKNVVIGSGAAASATNLFSNTIIGTNVSVGSGSLYNNVIIADGDGVKKIVSNTSGVGSFYYGTSVPSASTISATGNLFHVTGTTNITSVSGTDIYPGSEITIIFDGVLTFTDGSNLKLAGNFVTTADDTITLRFDGTNWYEKSRSVNSLWALVLLCLLPTAIIRKLKCKFKMRKIYSILLLLTISGTAFAQKLVKVTGGSTGTTSGSYDSTRKNTDSITAHRTQIDNLNSGKQSTLVSGTNIKTINGVSVLGSGNISPNLDSVKKNTDSITAHNIRIGANTTDISLIKSSQWRDTTIGTSGIYYPSGNVLVKAGNLEVLNGYAFKYGGVNAIRAIPSIYNWFFGPSGNLTASGNYNIAINYGALANITSAEKSIGIGVNALNALTTGGAGGGLDIAIGTSTLQSFNSYGATAIGNESQRDNIDGQNNTSIGDGVLRYNLHGALNSGFGVHALEYVHGSNITGNGVNAFKYLWDGYDAVGIGGQVGIGNGLTPFQTAVHDYSIVLIGNRATRKGTIDSANAIHNSIAIGTDAQYQKSNQTVIGNDSTTEHISYGSLKVGTGALGSPDGSAQLDVSSTTKGALIPRMTDAQMRAISSPVAGLEVTNTDSLKRFQYNGSAWVGNVDMNSTDFFQKLMDYSASKMVSFGNEFMTSNNDAVTTTAASGTAAAVNTTFASDINHPGIIGFGTGSTNAGLVALRANNQSILFGGGKWVWESLVNIPTLSNSTDRYVIESGFADQLNTGVNHNDGVYFLYDEGGVSTGSAASANWQLVTDSGTVRTFVTTSTAVTAGSTTWHKLRIEVNSAGTSAQYFVDGTSVGTITTNIPKSTGRETGYGFGIYKSAGTNSLTLQVDYFKVQNILTNSR